MNGENGRLSLTSPIFEPLTALYSSELIDIPQADAPIYNHLLQWKRVVVDGLSVQCVVRPSALTPTKRPNLFLEKQKKRKIREDLLLPRVSLYHESYYKEKILPKLYQKGPLVKLFNAMVSGYPVIVILKLGSANQNGQASSHPFVLTDPKIIEHQTHILHQWLSQYQNLPNIHREIDLALKNQNILGFVIGRCLLFDKHWNLQLKNAIQCITHRSTLRSFGLIIPRSRRKRQKLNTACGIQEPPTLGCTQVHSETSTSVGASGSSLIIQKYFLKLYPNIFIRGTQITVIK